MKYIVILSLILLLFSCGDETIHSNYTENNDINREMISKNGNQSEYTSDYPEIVNVDSFDEIPIDKKEEIPKIKSMSDDFYAGNEIERLNICKDSSYDGFLFDYMGFLINGYVGKSFLHFEINEPLKAIDIEEMDSLLPFTPQMTEYYDKKTRENFLWDFSSYVSIGDNVNPFSTGFNYMEEFKSFNSTMDKVDVKLYKTSDELVQCLSPKWSDFETYSDGDFGFGILNNPYPTEVAPKFVTSYSFNFNFESGGFCTLTNYSPSFDSCSDSHNCYSNDTWGHNSCTGCFLNFCYWDMEYEIYPREITSNIDGQDFTGSCYYYDNNKNEFVHYNNDFCNQKRFNLIVKDNNVLTANNPNSKNIHFPMKTFYLKNKPDELEFTSTNSISLIYLPGGIDFTINPNLTDIVQSSKVEELFHQIVKQDFEILVDYCNEEGHNKCPDKTELNSFYLLDNDCYKTIKDFSEEELVSFFQYFSDNPTINPLNSIFTTIESYKKCVYQVWNIYNKGSLKFVDSEYSWNYGLMRDNYNKTLNTNCKSYKNCSFGQYCMSNGVHPVGDIPCAKDEENCTCATKKCEDINDCLCREDGICIADKEGFGLECKLETTHYSGSCQLETEIVINERVDNIDINYSQTINSDEIDYYIDITPEKLGSEIFYFGGGFSSVKKLIAFNYYRNLRYSESTNEFIDSCHSNSECLPLNSDKIKYYCEYRKCSTLLETSSFEVKTVRANPLKIWLKWGFSLVPGNTSSEDWGESPSEVNININTVLYLLPRQNNKKLFIDFVPLNSNNFHFSIDANGELDYFSEDDIYSNINDKIEDKIVKLIIENPVIPIDTDFSIFNELGDIFEKVRGDIRDKINELLPENRLPKFDNVDSILESLDL
ncbi:hypothetical protein JXR93_09970 [bacterium]|nr:hypothetical protein [bacterium]